MRENHPHEKPGQREIVERHEVVERDVPPRGGPPARPPQNTAWIWLIPLGLVVLVLAWFIFTRGEPQRPFQEVTVPELEVPTVREERRIEVEVPAPQQQPPATEAPGEP